MNRRMAAASAAVCRERDTIHMVIEVDVSVPRRLIAGYAERTGERLSFTAYLVACLVRALTEFPEMNALVTRGRITRFEHVTVGVLVEREIDGERVPEPLNIQAADTLTLLDVHARIREAQRPADGRLGGLSGATWVRFVPGALFRTMIRIASRSVRVAERYGVVSVTSVGMFTSGALWMLPLSASSVALAVGSIVQRPVPVDGAIEWREHLCLTVSFDHDLIDGAPAARFTARLSEIIASGESIRAISDAASALTTSPQRG